MLPKFQTPDKAFSLLQTTWSQEINPILAQPLNNGLILKSVSLASGTNTINHLLGRTLQGWFIVRQRAAGTVYDTQDTNKIPDKTLVLVASTALVLDLFVF